MTTIRRQYSLPNCTLVVEGLSDAMGQGTVEVGRPLLSTAFSAECIFAGVDRRLSGGREFLNSLTRSVSAYAQEFLSGIRHPSAHDEGSQIVSFTRGEDSHIHHLVWHPEADANAGGGTPEPVSLDLNTVQLFDLVEAIDQLLADSRTLPDLTVALTPVSRRYRKADIPVAQRTAPAILGVASLAVAAVALFMLPIPQQIEEPKPAEQEQVEGEETPSPDEEPVAGAPPTPVERSTPSSEESPSAESSEESLSAEEIEEAIARASQITDPTTVRFIERDLRRQLDEAWEDRDRIDRDLEYRVSVARGGAIVAFEPVEDTPENAAERTPLPDLRYTPTDLGEKEEIADFRVVFTDRSVLQTSPWFGYQGEPTLGPEIEDRSALRRLNEELYDRIREDWEGVPSYDDDLVFRVGVTEEGAIADYEPDNQAAYDFADETPLPDLVNPEAAGIEEGENLVPQEPLAQFKVVFKPSGVLEVSPVRGL
ncbi:MAG: DUF4335 domain-containing protein [Cyanobacteriota bacterium]|nr:DUF4335 domain-containing protein [Cyanobacteriota bacterium]